VLSSKPKILIVDDDKAILQALSKIFQKKGYRVTTAEKGKEAIKEIAVHRYDVALVDLALPDMEGDKLFPLIQEASPKTVKIMLSGRIELEDNIEGADAFIPKPVAPDRLLNIIESKLTLKNRRKKHDRSHKRS